MTHSIEAAAGREGIDESFGAHLPASAAVVLDGMHRGLHVGAQLYVAVNGQIVADGSTGLARPGIAMSTDTMMIWFSSTKAVTSVAAARVWEMGGFDIDDPVCKYIPEFAANGKGAVTIRHLFTHTAGIRLAGRDAFGSNNYYAQALASVCSASLEDGWIPGRKAGYHPFSGMLVLAEIIHRIDGRSFSQYVREEVFEPLGMQDCWIGMSPKQHAAYGDRIGIMQDRWGPAPRRLPNVDSPEMCAQVVPAAGGRGPMRELARLYEMLRRRGELNGVRILTPQTVEAMTARQRVGMKDETFGIPIDWGLGFILKSFVYGRHASTRVFGHSGARSSVAFCDPEHGLVVAMVFNGMPAPAEHRLRQVAITSAIYEDLGLAAPDAIDPEMPPVGGGLV